MAIISTTEFKTFKNLSGSTYDTLIGLLIGAAQAEAERWCGRLFDSGSQTDTLNGSGSNILFLTRTPITAFTSLSVVASDGTSTAIDSTDYRYDATTGELRLIPESYGRIVQDDFGTVVNEQWGYGRAFPPGFRNIVAVYTGGYSSGTMPLDLKHAMYRYVDAMFQAFKDGGNEGLQYQSEDLGDYSYTKASATAMFDQFKALFKPYRGVTL